MKHVLQLAAVLSLLLSTPLLAAGDAGAGQGKAGICAACHNIDGNSVVPSFPKLAGQHAPYLERQLTLIKDGSRAVPEMAGITAMLSEQDIADIAAYFSGQVTAAGLSDEAMVSAGEALYRAGLAAKEVPACMSCHGPAGKGNPLAGYPALAGQHATYSEKMLKGFRAGQRWGDDDGPSKIMAEVATRLSDDEIRALASYIQGLHAVQ